MIKIEVYDNGGYLGPYSSLCMRFAMASTPVAENNHTELKKTCNNSGPIRNSLATLDAHHAFTCAPFEMARTPGCLLVQSYSNGQAASDGKEDPFW